MFSPKLYKHTSILFNRRSVNNNQLQPRLPSIYIRKLNLLWFTLVKLRCIQFRTTIVCFSASHSCRCLPILPSQPTSNPTKNEVIVRSTELNRPDCEQGNYNYTNSAANLLQPSIKRRIYGHSEEGCNTKTSAPATTQWTATFKGAKTTKDGLINKYDVSYRPYASRMQVDDVIHDMSLNLSLDHVANRSNDQYGDSGSPRDHPHLQPIAAPWLPTWPSATNAAAPAGKTIYQSLFINKSLMNTNR